MKILVTGSDGLVGSSLRFLGGDNQWIFIKRKQCDLTNREATIDFFSKIKPDYVVHLASYVPGFYNINRVASFTDNVRINENVLEASHLAGIERGIFCLSVNMFADSSKLPIEENMINEGALTGIFSGYAYAKRMLALQCQNYNEQHNRKYFGIIPCNVYGPGDNSLSGRLVPNLIFKFKEAIKNNTDVTINGSGKPLRQFIHSLDLAKIIYYLVFNYNDTKPIICCGDEEISISELASKISSATEFKNQIIFDAAKPDGNFKKTMSNSYLKSIMSNLSFISLEEGIKGIV